MTFTDTTMYEMEEKACNFPPKPEQKPNRSIINNKKVWKALRRHILTHREKKKQVQSDAEVLRKKMYLQNQKLQETKLSLAQINGRLSELRGKKDLLEEEKRALLEQKQANDYNAANPETKDIDSRPKTNGIVNGAGTTMSFSQHQQPLINMISTRPELAPEDILADEPLSVVIPTNTNGGKQNYWIIHHTA